MRRAATRSRRTRPRLAIAAAILMLVVVPVAVAGINGTFAAFVSAPQIGGSVAAGEWAPPEPPSGLACDIELWDFEATLRWDAVEGAEQYAVYHGGPFSGFMQLLALVEAPATSYEALRPSLLHHRYYVTAAGGAGESAPSDLVSVHCAPRSHFYHGPHSLTGGGPSIALLESAPALAGPPPDARALDGASGLEGGDAPATLAAPPVLALREVPLSWTADGRSTRYVVLRSEQAGGPYLEVGSAEEPSFIDGPLPAELTYFYVVVGVDEAGAESDPTNEIVAPGMVPPPPAKPLPSPTATPSPTPTPSPSATSSPSPSPSSTPSSTATLSPTPTAEASPTPAPSASGTPTPTPAPTATPTPTASPTPAATPTPTVEPTPTLEPTPTATPTPTVEPTPTIEPTPTVEATPTSTVEATPTEEAAAAPED